MIVIHGNRYVYAALIALAFFLFGFWKWSQYISKPPIEKTIYLNIENHLAEEIVAPVSATYRLEFVFDRRGRSVQEISALSGELGGAEKTKDPGVGVPVHWSVKDAKSKRVISEHFEVTRGSSGWSDEEVTRDIEALNLPAGSYELHVDTQAVKPLADQSIEVRLKLDQKNSDTSAMTFYWIGSILYFIVAVPAMVVLSWIALMDTIRRARSR